MPENQSTTERISISRKVTLGMVFTLVMLGLIALVSFVSLRRFIATWAEIAQSREILERCERVERYFIEMESGVRGYLLTGKAADLDPYDHGLSFNVQELKALGPLSSDHPGQQAHISKLQTI